MKVKKREAPGDVADAEGSAAAVSGAVVSGEASAADAAAAAPSAEPRVAASAVSTAAPPAADADAVPPAAKAVEAAAAVPPAERLPLPTKKISRRISSTSKQMTQHLTRKINVCVKTTSCYKK